MAENLNLKINLIKLNSYYSFCLKNKQNSHNRKKFPSFVYWKPIFVYNSYYNIYTIFFSTKSQTNLFNLLSLICYDEFVKN